jgi:PBP1b-binding outer membrane lipoprotein LpoB
VASLISKFLRLNQPIRASILVAALLLSACATLPPVQEMSDARQAIAAAREAGAENYAASQLIQAQELLATAEGYLETGTSNAYWQARKAAVSAKEVAFDALLTSRNAQYKADRL